MLAGQNYGVKKGRCGDSWRDDEPQLARAASATLGMCGTVYMYDWNSARAVNHPDR